MCYLNSAGRTPLPTPTLAVGLRAVARKASTPWAAHDSAAEARRHEQREEESCQPAMMTSRPNLRHRESVEQSNAVCVGVGDRCERQVSGVYGVGELPLP